MLLFRIHCIYYCYIDYFSDTAELYLFPGEKKHNHLTPSFHSQANEAVLPSIKCILKSLKICLNIEQKQPQELGTYLSLFRCDPLQHTHMLFLSLKDSSEKSLNNP